MDSGGIMKYYIRKILKQISIILSLVIITLMIFVLAEVLMYAYEAISWLPLIGDELARTVAWAILIVVVLGVRYKRKKDKDKNEDK